MMHKNITLLDDVMSLLSNSLVVSNLDTDICQDFVREVKGSIYSLLCFLSKQNRPFTEDENHLIEQSQVFRDIWNDIEEEDANHLLGSFYRDGCHPYDSGDLMHGDSPEYWTDVDYDYKGV